VRDLRALPKAHLQVHFTGSMYPASVRELAARHGLDLPMGLLGKAAPLWVVLRNRDWSAFQARYDAARAAVRTVGDIRRLVREAAEGDAADGSGWLEIQVDPTSYASHVGGLELTFEVILEAARDAEQVTGGGVGVVGFGLSNDERRGRVPQFARAFRIAGDAGLPGCHMPASSRGRGMCDSAWSCWAPGASGMGSPQWAISVS